MPTPNPDYDPNALKFQTAHAQKLERLSQLRCKQYSDDLLNPDEIAEQVVLEAQTTAGKDAFLHSFYTMQPTIQDYARFVMSFAFPPPGFPVPVEELDYEPLKTRDAVNRLFTIFNAAVKTYGYYLGQRRPLGQPHGLSAFSEAGNVRQLTLTFNLDTPIGPSTTKAIALVDEQDDGVHLCLAYTPQDGVSVVNGIERMATSLLLRQREIAQKENATPALAKDFNFYIYIPPQYNQEAFIRIKMSFVDGAYKQPDFQHYNSVPQCVRKIAHDLMNIDLALLKSLKVLDAPSPQGDGK